MNNTIDTLGIKKISMSLAIAALLVTGCSDKPKEETTTTQESKAADTSTAQEPVKDLYGVHPTDSTTQEGVQTVETKVEAGTKHTANVLETMNAANYTYAKVDEGGNIYWIAGPQAKIQVGDEISFIDQMVMEDFRSKALNKTFEYLVFASTLVPTHKSAQTAVKQDHNCDTCATDTPAATANTTATDPHAGMQKSTPAVEEEITVITLPKAEGGYTIEELYTKKVDLKDKKVKVNAKVVKVSRNIMNKDWIHLQDGTGNAQTSDVVVTAQNADVKVGDTVLVDAILQTDVDFGYGYFFPVILQEGTFTK